MNYYLLFYLFSIADGVAHTLIGLAVAGAIILFVISMVRAISSDDMQTSSVEGIKKVQRRLLYILPALLILSAVIPSKKDMLLIVVGGTVAEFATTNKNMQALPNDIVAWARTEILTQTKELSPELLKQKDNLLKASERELSELAGDTTKNSKK